MVHRTSHSAAGSCDYTCGGERYDMRGLLRLGGAAITAADKSGAVYHVGVCGQELPPSLQCNSSTAAGRVSSGSNSAADLVAATRVSGGGCSTIGTWEDRSGLPMPCYQRDPSNPSSGIKCHLYAGDETTGSSVVVEYVCRPEGALPPITVRLSVRLDFNVSRVESVRQGASAEPVALQFAAVQQGEVVNVSFAFFFGGGIRSRPFLIP